MKFQTFLTELEGASVMELNDLVKQIEEDVKEIKFIF